ncbi:MAG: DUF362 domain-containing protein [Candidatus Helarchaeales archaeon]
MKKSGRRLYSHWNYEIWKDGEEYIGYEIEVKDNLPKSFLYIHQLGDPVPESVHEAMDHVKLNQIISHDDHVAIKVNLCGGFPGIIASQTPLRVVSGLLDKILEICDPEQVFLCEANNWGHVVDERLLKKRGYYQLCKEKGVKFYNLSVAPAVKFYFKGFSEPVLLSRLLLHPKVKLINVAPIKHHWECGVTLAQKNLYGAIADESKTKFHDYVSKNALDMVIAGAARVYNPALNILGGKCVCAGQGPHFCRPRRFGYLIISNDMLAADKVGSDVLGFPWKLVAHAQINKQFNIWNEDCERLPDSVEIPEFIKNRIRKHVIPPEIVMRNRVGLKFIYRTNPRLLRRLRYFEFVIPIVNTILFGLRGDCSLKFKEE